MMELIIVIMLSVIAGLLATYLIKEFKPMLIKANLYGVDMCKRKCDQTKIPEPMGVITATTYLIIMFISIPFIFSVPLLDDDPEFPHSKFVEFVAGLLSICCMILLGFADDVLDLRWRHKLLLPTLASLPLLVVFFANHNSTTMVLPTVVGDTIGRANVNLGFLYYIFMGMLAVFCTNAINILAGVNGIEVGQSMVIAVFIVLFNVIQISRVNSQLSYHYFSLFFLLPFLGSSAALLKSNWYPAESFVGDTFCYFAGMTFAVVGILGHFSKTLLLFFLPQIFNFIYSIPQLFHFVPCPRHRLPKYDQDSDCVHMSITKFRESEIPLLGRLSVFLLHNLGLLHVRRCRDDWTETNNFTILNLVLKFTGPIHERKLTSVLLVLQTFCCVLGLFVRFFVARLFYTHVY